ncbi:MULTISPECIES: ferrous iron transport protein B [Clostridia]|uniref:ferrous iron transport protein B n=1 Tax=Clostridia TaxID=186801 RepID=UPI000EA3E738|nr:ferrous iron transport protein B [Clostridium sp. 1xD42-85]NBJ69554.1 ferrous iron transport protein B [Roseburia sp. 1XD42-34]RKI78626.1 ferrous iron transport protein B [Clostridium sp. 1xD42-85]
MSQFALFGNPNTGKTSLFNNLTGSYEYVGNWSGVTIEKKVGKLRNQKGLLVDLPGVYSLNPLSKDEEVVTEFLLTGEFEKILNIVDASQLKRNLQLTVQLMEFGKPLIVGLNMIDVAQIRGMKINNKKLADILGVRVVPIIARTGKGCDLLTKELTNHTTKESQTSSIFKVDYGFLEEMIDRISQLIPNEANLNKRWVAIQYLEGNKRITSYLDQHISNTAMLEQIKQEAEEELVKRGHSCSLRQFIYHMRDKNIIHILEQVITVTSSNKTTATDLIDRMVTNKFLGLPIFLFFMYVMFMLTFDWLGSPLSDVLGGFFSGPLTNGLENGLNAIGGSSFIKDLVLNGIVAGVGGVLVFVPQIFIMFFLISFLEDSGYMARVAMVMDRIMESIGLNGKAFIPMIIGFGCNVPGIMAARTIEQPKERLLTILLTPFMSCSARLPVYALFVGAFFVKQRAIVVLSLYVLGIVVAMVMARIFSYLFLKNEKSVFVIELPPYRVPQALTLWRSTWEKGKGFIRKAGTFIFAGSVLIWLLTYAGPHGLNVEMDDSFLALIGGVLAPVFQPLGFGTWQAAASLLTGFLAKEVVVSTMNIIYHVPDTASLAGILSTQYSALSALSFMSFILLYVPCLATVATIRKETASKKWSYISIIYSLLIAYIISTIIYQIGGLLF